VTELARIPVSLGGWVAVLEDFDWQIGIDSREFQAIKIR
jgi:hypothetical protein